VLTLLDSVQHTVMVVAVFDITVDLHYFVTCTRVQFLFQLFSTSCFLRFAKL